MESKSSLTSWPDGRVLRDEAYSTSSDAEKREPVSGVETRQRTQQSGRLLHTAIPGGDQMVQQQFSSRHQEHHQQQQQQVSSQQQLGQQLIGHSQSAMTASFRQQEHSTAHSSSSSRAESFRSCQMSSWSSSQQQQQQQQWHTQTGVGSPTLLQQSTEQQLQRQQQQQQQLQHHQQQRQLQQQHEQQQVLTQMSSRQQVMRQHTQQHMEHSFVRTTDQAGANNGSMRQPNLAGSATAAPSPPIFRQIFRNARLAQGKTALFEGQVTGNPTPEVQWTRQGTRISNSSKHQLQYDVGTGRVSLSLLQIGPGDQGEYTCTATNCHGEAVCTVCIQPEETFRNEQTNGKAIQDNATCSNIEKFNIEQFEFRLRSDHTYRQSILRHHSSALLQSTLEHTKKDAVIGSSVAAGGGVRLVVGPRAVRVPEGGEAVFQVQLAGISSCTRTSWFCDGRPLQPDTTSNTTSTSSCRLVQQQEDGIVTLRVRNAAVADAGHYTVLAEDVTAAPPPAAAAATAAVVATAYLVVEPATTALATQQALLQSSAAFRSHYTETGQRSSSTPLSKPKFVKVPDSKQLQSGTMVRFECSVEGHPTPKVTWLLNDRVIGNDEVHKVMVNEMGGHTLLITNVTPGHSGVLTVIASNQAGQDQCQANLSVTDKPEMTAPKFINRLMSDQIQPGDSKTFSCQASGCPTPQISWQKDGQNLKSSHDTVITTNGASSQLQIINAGLGSGGWYQCTARNTAGSTVTKARLTVAGHDQEDGQQQSHPQSHPQQQQQTRPGSRTQSRCESEQSSFSEVVHLRHIEKSVHQESGGLADEPAHQVPVFTRHLNNVQIVEGGRIQLDAKLSPIGDSSLRVDWFLNGTPLAASSRVTATYNLGNVTLSILAASRDDCGVFTCVASNQMGSAQTTSTVVVDPRPSIESASIINTRAQSMQEQATVQTQQWYHQEQEQTMQTMQMTTTTDTTAPAAAQEPPVFLTQLKSVHDAVEGSSVRLETQLRPSSDSSMRLDWFKNGHPLTASSRIASTNSFGHVALHISKVRTDDQGLYTVRAVNQAGEAVNQAEISVLAQENVTDCLGIPEQQRHLESVKMLEFHRHSTQLHQQSVRSESQLENYPPPTFTQQLVSVSATEGATVSFEARIQPSGDPSLRVDWFKDGKQLEASSRSAALFSFGAASLTIRHLAAHDAGHYVCVAHSGAGRAESAAQLQCHREAPQTAHAPPGSGATVERLEPGEKEPVNKRPRRQDQSTPTIRPPKFLTQIKGTNIIREGQRAHFEAKLENQQDCNMQVEWFLNSEPVAHATRIQSYWHFGYAALDITGVKSEDAGVYTLRVRNEAGEISDQIEMRVEAHSTVDTSSIHHGFRESSGRHQQTQSTDIHEDSSIYSISKPFFTESLRDQCVSGEGCSLHWQCRVEPAGDPTLRVDWLLNGHPVTIGSRRCRQTLYYGLATLDVAEVSRQDLGVYTAKVVNQLGECECSAHVRMQDRPAMGHSNDIEPYMEVDKYSLQRQESEAVTPQAPTFTKPLKNIETVEGTNVHLECRLQPTGDNTMTVEWFINEQPLNAGHRFRPAHEFDYVALDLLTVYPRDSGIFTCRATNSSGQAVTSASVRVTAKEDVDHTISTEKYRSTDDTVRIQKRDWVEEEVQTKPHFLTQLKSQEALLEGQNAHFEAKLEPVSDSNLQVEWLKDGCPIIVGHRHRPLHDFGYVALDIVGIIESDAGVYTCRATNRLGTDQTSATLTCSGEPGVSVASKMQYGTERFQMTEDRARMDVQQTVEETTTQAPVFTTSLTNVSIREGQRAHFESRLIPVSDPTMTVHWFLNGQPVKTGSRFAETNSFGFVALDILHAYAEDEGTYTCRATNAIGEAITQATLLCYSPDTVDSKSVHEQTLEKLRQLEQKSGHRRRLDELVTQAPVFTAPIRDICVLEGRPLHFEARLIPVGDPRLRVEWFKNNVPLQMANRISILHDFGFVALDIKQTQEEDSGTYSCRAINELGQAVTSATAIVQSKESILTTYTDSSLEKLRILEERSRSTTAVDDIIVTEKPSFSLVLTGKQHLVEGESAHLEARVKPYPDPDMKIEWLFNGNPLSIGHRYCTISEFGFVALDVLSAAAEDSGQYSVVATNRHGASTSSLQLTVQSRAALIQSTQHPAALQQISYLESDRRHWTHEQTQSASNTTTTSAATRAPVFGRSLRNVSLNEGQSCHLEATLTPVNDASMRVEWFRDGHPISHGHRFRTTNEFGFVALDILYTYVEDSGTYMCKATNAAGEAVTTCSTVVSGNQGLCTETLDLARMEKIKSLENAGKTELTEPSVTVKKPVFTTALVNLENLYEGEHVHLECRLEPVNDPSLKVEWFVNSKEVKAGHRFRTTHDFGYVALDILYGYAEDSGTYMCKASNEKGEAISTCSVRIDARRSIYLDTSHPERLQKIKDLESKETGMHRETMVTFPAPRFVHNLKGVTQLSEGQRVHLEARVEPLHDATLQIEWLHNGQALAHSSRCHTTFDFGYVALDIGRLLAEDSGQYTCRAVSQTGEATSAVTLQVLDNKSVIESTDRPAAVETIRQLETRSSTICAQQEETAVSYQKPVFTQPLQSVDSLDEGRTLTLTARLIPVGDPRLTLEWLKNDQPIQTGTRYTSTHEFGCVSLEISALRKEDEGVYMCRAKNQLGEAVTTASLSIKSQATIISDAQHPVSMEKLKALEFRPLPTDVAMETVEFERPVFTMSLTGQPELVEGQHAQLRARCLPVGDATLRFEWFCNGAELKIGSRFKETHDFGFVTLDINSVVPEDSGIYMCRAINSMGEAITSFSMKIKDRRSVLGDAISTMSWSQIQQSELSRNQITVQRTYGADADSVMGVAPVFTTHLQSHDHLTEQQSVHLEANLEPKTDAHLRVEWSKNGLPLMTGARLRSTFDFGLVTLDIVGLRGDDSGIYTCHATNRLGGAVTTCTIKVEDKHWLLSQAQRPESLPVLSCLEQPAVTVCGDRQISSPAIRSHLNNVTCAECETARFHCQVQPITDATMKIEWFLNKQPMKIGSRITSQCEFGRVQLQIGEVQSCDAGVIVCRVSNGHGSAQTTGTLNVKTQQGIDFGTAHPTGEQGLEKIKQLDSIAPDVLSPMEKKFSKPRFTRCLEAKSEIVEAQPFELSCQVEPRDDPTLKVEWYFNSQAILQGSRLQISNEFGSVQLRMNQVDWRDQGIYTCRASNSAGEAFTSTTAAFSDSSEMHVESEESLAAELHGLPGEKCHPPRFTSKFENVTGLSEHDSAHFEATLVPVGDQTMTVDWLYEDRPLTASHRIRTIHAYGMVVLDIVDTRPEDSGRYKCRATNRWGSAEICVQLECSRRSAGEKPRFITNLQSVNQLNEGDSVHLECQLVPLDDPQLTVEWLHNEQPLAQSSRMKTVHDFGYVTLDIADLRLSDGGEYTCRATNHHGSATSRAQLTLSREVGSRRGGAVVTSSQQPQSLQSIAHLERQQQQQLRAAPGPISPEAQPPRFIKPLTSVQSVTEGHSAHLEAQVTPINDSTLNVEWYRNGDKLPSGHRFRTFHDFGIVILDILYCYEEDSGVYECRATNKIGTDCTKAQLTCSPKAGLVLSPQIPDDMSGGLEKIQQLEDSALIKRKISVETKQLVAPKFITPFANIYNLKEGENAHFEARLTPSNDSNLKMEWYYNNKPLSASSRIRTMCDFGFVVLEIAPVYPEDSGEYTCRAVNEAGEATTSAGLQCSGKRSIVLESQLPKGMAYSMEKISVLEGINTRREGIQLMEEGMPPKFLSQPSDVTLTENQLAHFECRLVPIGDPSMRIEWFHNGKPLTSGSRIRTVNDFGYVILEIGGIYQRDSGRYTCKAVNRHGETATSCLLTVKGRQGIIMEPQLPQGIDGIRKLEESLYRSDVALVEEEQNQPPRFVEQIAPQGGLLEGQPAHFECRVEPVGDPSMQIEWLHNGRTLNTGSRVHVLNDFGFIVLDLDWTYPRDSGEYTCRATNKWGSAATKARLTCQDKQSVIMDSQLPQGMSGERLRELEESLKRSLPCPTELQAEVPPKFVREIEDVQICEGEVAFFECQIEPKNDSHLGVQWFCNDKLVKTGHRFRTTFDFGYASLQILSVYPEDGGVYTCQAKNRIGQATSSSTLTCSGVSPVIMLSQVPKGMQKCDYLMQMEAVLKQYTSKIFLTEHDIYDSDKHQPPRFVNQIESKLDLTDMQETKFECQLSPVGDPSMKVEWFFNGRPLPYKNRFTPIYDFGYVAMNFAWVYPEDSAEYICRATNLYGTDETKAIIKTKGKPGIVYDSQLPAGMESVKKIQEMEALRNRGPDTKPEEERPQMAPQFVTQPESVTVTEGEWVRFYCRVTGHPRPRVMWLINGRTIVNGSRFKLTYDGMWRLDIPKTKHSDNGKIEVIARNSAGEAYCCCQVKIEGKQEDYRALLKSSPKRHTEGSPGYRKPDWVVQMEETKAEIRAKQKPPVFTSEFSDLTAKENDEEVQFRCVVDGIPRPEIQCFHNETRLTLSRFARIVYVDNRVSLTLCSLTADMAGTYSVRAANAVGEAVTSACLTITELTEEEREEIKKKKEELLRKRKQREEDRIARLEQKRQLQEEAARKLREKKEFLRPQKIQKSEQPTTKVASMEKASTVVDSSQTQQMENVKFAKAEARRRLVELESYIIAEIDVQMSTEELEQFVVERSSAERRLSTLDAALVQEISPQAVSQELEKISAEKVVAETKLSILNAYSVREITPQTTATELKVFVGERRVAEERWQALMQTASVQSLCEHIAGEINQVCLDRSVAEFKLNMADAFQVQELRPDLGAEELETFIEERKEARRRVSTSCALDVIEVTSEEVVRDLARLLSVEEVSAQMKLDLMRAYAVQEVTTQSSLDEMKTFITEMHHVEQMLSTALTSAENAEVCPQYVAAEIDHIRVRKSRALDHLELVSPQAVQEIETLLQATFPLKKFKDFDYDYYFGAITVYFNIYLPPEGSEDPEYLIERIDPVNTPK